MAGTVRKHPRVRIEWDARRTQDGRPYALLVWERQGARTKEPIGCVSRDEAEERRGDKEAALRLGLTPTSPPSSPPVPLAPATVGDAVLAYLLALPSMPGGAGHQRHERRYCLALDRLLGTVAITGLTSARLRAYTARRKAEPLAPRGTGRPRTKPSTRPVPARVERTDTPSRITVVNEYACLRRVVRAWCEAAGTKPPTFPATRDVFAGWEEDHRPPRQLTEAEVRALVAAGAYTVTHGPHVGADRSHVGRLVGFLAWCPRRPVAVFALRIRDTAKATAADVPRSGRVAWFDRDKGGKGRGWSPLTTPALDYLRTQVEARIADGAGPDDLVWLTEEGNAWSAESFWRVVQRVAARAKVEGVTTYDLRKFGAAQVYRRKPNLKVVMQYTGHKNPAVLLNNYIFPARDEAEEAAEGIGWSAVVVRLVEDGE